MTNITPASNAEFFGKDSFVPFMGVVEDVNDPKRSGRVKVRCVGWHPKAKEGEDGLKTEDLPWAKTGMPVTHAQQSRIGGKHGLMVGSWVWGFFLDGDEAQQPFVCQSFNFTANAVDEDTRSTLKGEDGVASKEDQAFDKVTASPKTQPNIALRTKEEQGQKGFGSSGDKSGDVTADDSDDPCSDTPRNRSVATERRTEDELKEQDNANGESQKYGVSIADGMCGTISHARDDIAKKMKEKLPSQLARFTFNDVVWNRFSGNFINLNGLLAAMAKEISEAMKQPSQSKKAVKETENRKKKSEKLLEVKDRDGVLRLEIDATTTEEDDLFHALFAESMIDQLLPIVLQMLRAMNNGDSGTTSGENAGEIGATADTPISNNEAQCITDTIINNVSLIADSSIEIASAASSGGGGSDNTAITQILSTLLDVMQFPLTQQYAKHVGLFNRQGKRSQDKKNKEAGCNNEREYVTHMGALKSIAGFALNPAGGSGGGSSKNNNSPGNNDPSGVGFGGYPGPSTGDTSTLLCEEAGQEPVQDPAYDNGTSGSLPGTPVSGGTGTPGAPGAGGNGQEFVVGRDGIEIVSDPQVLAANSGLTENQFPVPRGRDAIVIAASLPSKDQICAQNFINGVPNILVVIDPGRYYFFNNIFDDYRKAYPSIYIPNYNGVPTPVVDPKSGELVAVLSDCTGYDQERITPPVTVIPDDNSAGIRSDDPRYNIKLSTFFIENTGFQYTNPTARIIDRDTGEENGEVSVVVVEGRIVELEIINTGGNFRRLPEVTITDETGFGCKVRPIMDVQIKTEETDLAVPPVEVIYCPSKNQTNLL